MYQTIKYEVKDKVATVTINRPEALNALNSTVLDELFDVFNVIDKDENVKLPNHCACPLRRQKRHHKHDSKRNGKRDQIPSAKAARDRFF